MIENAYKQKKKMNPQFTDSLMQSIKFQIFYRFYEIEKKKELKDRGSCRLTT